LGKASLKKKKMWKVVERSSKRFRDWAGGGADGGYKETVTEVGEVRRGGEGSLRW